MRVYVSVVKPVQARFISVLLSLIIFPLVALAQENVRVERGNLILENLPDMPDAMANDSQHWQDGRAATFLDWAGDGKGMLIATRLDGVGQVYRVVQPLTAPRPLTAFPKALSTSAVAQPRGEGFVYFKDQDGDEYFQLYFHNIRTGQEALITDGRRSRNLGPLWSKDGRQLVYVHIPEGTKRYQIRIAHAEALEMPKTIFDREDDFSIEDWSADGRMLLLRRYVSKTESYLYTLSVTNGRLHEINSRQGGAPKVAYGGGRYSVSVLPPNGLPKGGRFSVNGRSVYAISDQDSEFDRLVKIDVATATQTVLTKNLSWGVEAFELSPDGQSIVYSVNENGISTLHVMDAETGAALPAPSLPAGVIDLGSFDREGKQFAFTFFGAATPADVYVWDLGKQSLARWTESEMGGGIDPAVLAALAEPELIRFPSFDGREISAFLYRPKRAGKKPVLIHFHGGPDFQFRPVFNTHPTMPIVLGLELGFAVIAPNVRGSTGYGKTFVALDDGIKREDSVKDAGALLDWIAKQPSLDNDRIFIQGVSYGGYMVNASAMHFSERLKGAISVVAISDFNNYFQHTAEYRRDTRRAEYGDERDPNMAAYFKSISVLDHADRITVPMFIVHGVNDPRVPVQEAEQLFGALKAKGARPWLMLFKDEGHGVSKKENIRYLKEAVALFLTNGASASCGCCADKRVH